mmetsp:Transcript_12788/g.18164  ORF Transcript_12788/g.18164 Transcript_12788/m.18164 type:complete len:262 (+) Transcript_12788:1263-2048(+)
MASSMATRNPGISANPYDMRKLSICPLLGISSPPITDAGVAAAAAMGNLADVLRFNGVNFFALSPYTLTSPGEKRDLCSSSELLRAPAVLLNTARPKGVAPVKSIGANSPISSGATLRNISTASTCPASAAIWRAVRPCKSRSFHCCIGSKSSKISKAVILFTLAAAIKGVYPSMTKLPNLDDRLDKRMEGSALCDIRRRSRARNLSFKGLEEAHSRNTLLRNSATVGGDIILIAVSRAAPNTASLSFASDNGVFSCCCCC